MIKSVIKFSIVFVLTVLMAICAAGAAYIVTKRIVNSGENSPQEVMKNPIDDVVVGAEGEKTADAKVLVPDYYTVRLEGETLGVYAAFSEREDFLYNAEVYKTNLSAEDIRLLTSGVKLENHAELTSFIEDYTS